MTKTIDGAIVDWLEEIPVDELTCEVARMIVDQLRRKDIPASEAIEMLECNCMSSMQMWLDTNLEYSKMF